MYEKYVPFRPTVSLSVYIYVERTCVVAQADTLRGFIFKVNCTNVELDTDIPEKVFFVFLLVPPVNLATLPSIIHDKSLRSPSQVIIHWRSNNESNRLRRVI
jgi:hypothetical protein